MINLSKFNHWNFCFKLLELRIINKQLLTGNSVEAESIKEAFPGLKTEDGPNALSDAYSTHSINFSTGNRLAVLYHCGYFLKDLGGHVPTNNFSFFSPFLLFALAKGSTVGSSYLCLE